MNEAFRFNNAQARADYFRKKAGGDASAENQPDEAGQLKISYSETTDAITKRPIHNIFIYNLLPEDVLKIVEALKRNPETKAAFIPRRNAKGCVQIHVFEGNMDKWLHNGGMQVVQDILRKSGHYDEQEINDMPGYIANVALTKGEMSQEYAQAENKAIDVWLAYLQDINNPEIRKKLEAYQRVYRFLDVKYGHVKSAKNVAAIMATDSNATFILTPAEWRKLNRYVKPNATRFLVLAPLTDGIDKSKLDKVIAELGWKGTEYRDLPYQVQQKVDIKCQERGLNTPFAHYIEFDISDTAVIPGKEDLFNTQIGLLNNLTGELNAKAKEHYDLTHNIKSLPKDEEMIERTKKAAEFIVEFCKKNHVPFTPSENDDASTVLVNGLVAYYTSIAEHDANIDKDTNKELFAKNATLFTLIITNLAWDKIANFAHSVNYTKKEGAEFLKSVTYVLNRLEPALALEPQAIEVNESAQVQKHTKEEILSRFKDFCNQYGIKII